MKCLNKFLAILAVISTITVMTGCGKDTIPVEYGKYNLPSNYNIDSKYSEKAVPLFAQDLCASSEDITISSGIDTSAINAAGCYDVSGKKVLYSYKANDRLEPASLTKIMTALVVLRKCSLDEQVTIPNVTFSETGVQLFGLREGDIMTVRDLLYINLVYSGNDASLALAKYVSGSEEEFVQLMNEEALNVGATHTNFANSHGLSNENHYTTAYDLYLIFNAALKYDDFVNIISSKSYTVNYRNAAGEPCEKTITTTNKYLDGTYVAPNGMNVAGGKTGSTYAAGKCLIMYSLDSVGNPFISVVMGAADEAILYNIMTTLVNDTVK